MTDSDEYYSLNDGHVDPKRLRQEREKAKKLRKSSWWIQRLQAGKCHYCELQFKPSELTMDHIVPLARGGKSNPGNIVPACKECNSKKKLDTPVDQILRKISQS